MTSVVGIGRAPPRPIPTTDGKSAASGIPLTVAAGLSGAGIHPGLWRSGRNRWSSILMEMVCPIAWMNARTPLRAKWLMPTAVVSGSSSLVPARSLAGVGEITATTFQRWARSFEVSWTRDSLLVIKLAGLQRQQPGPIVANGPKDNPHGRWNTEHPRARLKRILELLSDWPLKDKFFNLQRLAATRSLTRERPTFSACVSSQANRFR